VVRDGGDVRIALDDGPPEQSCKPAVDVLFRSVAAVYGHATLACVLTGMGHDGTAGARPIVEAGGVVLAQDIASCVVPSMPRSVTQAGLVERVVPLAELAAELHRRMGTRAPARAAAR
jgi:two-component system, chemotaxis family, protein-glutamate methylesterase/glutaminase